MIISSLGCRCRLGLMTGCLLAIAAAEASATITNGDFSSGRTGWSTSGVVSGAASYTYPDPNGGRIDPQAGTRVTELVPDGGNSLANVLHGYNFRN